MSRFINPWEQFIGPNGQPFEAGTVFFGLPNQDPVANPKQPFSDAAFTVALGSSQTLDDRGMFQTEIFLNGLYSVSLFDKKGNFIRTSPSLEGSGGLAAFIADLADDTDLSKGVALVGRATQNHLTVSAMTADVNLSSGQFVAVDDYATGNNSGKLLFKAAGGAASAPDGGTQIDHDTLSLHFVQIFPSQVSVKMFGAKGDGVQSEDVTMVNAHLAFNSIYYPDGTYLFNAENLNLVDIDSIKRETEAGVIFKNSRYTEIISFDRSGALIGLHHNHLELKSTGTPTIVPQITSGNIVPPPVFASNATYDIDLFAFWFPRFGLDATRDTAANGISPYTWQGLHTDSAVSGAPFIELGYLPARHPKLGWYRGDDANVLDWICYWLLESGFRAVIVNPIGLDNTIDDSGWSTLSHIDHWLFNLLTNTKNGKQIGIIPWVDIGDQGSNFGNATALQDIEDNWDTNVRVIDEATAGYITHMNGLTLFTVFLFDAGSIRGDFDNFSGATEMTAMLLRRATFAKSLGYDGIAILSRNPVVPTTLRYDTLEAGDVYFISTGYGSTSNISSTTGTYVDWASGFDHKFPYNSIPSFSAERESSAHPSDWTLTGSTPELYEFGLLKMCRLVTRDLRNPDMVTLYNVSEWNEGGVSFVPTLGEGWNYMNATLNAISKVTTKEIQSFNGGLYFDPSTTVGSNHEIIDVGLSGSGTLVFTPHIADGYHMQRLTVWNTSKVIAGRSVTWQDESVLTGSGIFFQGGANRVLADYESFTVRFHDGKGWVEEV